MRKFKRIFAAVTVMTMLGVAAVPVPASALTAEELQVQIDALLAQLATLQTELTELTGEEAPTTGAITGVPDGFTFETNLAQGDSGSDVMYLQIVLNSDSDTKLADSGAGSPGSETTFFGPITNAGVVKFQEKYADEVLATYGLTSGTGFVGTTTRAKLNSLLGAAPAGEEEPTGEEPTGEEPIVEGDLSVATPGPAVTTFVAGQATANLIDLTFVGTATVTGLTLERIGVSSNTTASNVYLFDGVVRLTDAGTVNSDGVVTFNNANGLFIVSGVKTISVKSDILNGSGETLGMQLTAVTLASGTVSGLPVTGNLNTIASASLGTVTLGLITPTTSTIDAANDVIVWESTATVGLRKVSLTRLALRNIGSINSTDVQNFRLQVSGVEVAQTQSLDSSGFVTFDLSASPYVLDTGNRILRVMADVIGGASRNLQMSLRRAADIGLVDSSFNVNITASDTYPASTGVVDINAGTMTVVKASDSPSGNITDAAVDAVLARYTFTAFGEPIKVETLNAVVDSSDNAVAQLRNGRIMVNGAQVGSTAALVEENTTATGTQYTTNFIVNPGTPVTVEIRADIFDDDGTNDVISGVTLVASLAQVTGNAVPQTSLGTINVPTANQAANQVSVATGSATLVATASYPNQTFTVPITAYKIAEWDLTNGSTEAVNITTLDADFARTGNLLIGSLSDVWVKYGSNTSTVKSSVILTPNVWSVNFQLAKSETMKIQVFANISSFSITSDTVTVTMEVSGTGVDSATTVTTSAQPGQTMTAGTGTLVAALDASSPNSALIDDSGTVNVAAFEWTTTNDIFTITEINVKLSTATAVTSVHLMDGTTALSTKPGAIDVTFGGLSIPIVANGTKTLGIDLVMSTVGFGFGLTASDVAVTLDVVTSKDSQGVEYVDASPNSDQGSLNDDGGDPVGNATYAYKAVPTITLVSLPTGLLGTGTKTLSKFTINTNGTGTIAWRKLLFTVTKSIVAGDGVISAPALWEGNEQVTGTAIVTNLGVGQSPGSITFLATSEEAISGAKTYELRATIAGTIAVNDSINTSIANPLTTFAASLGAFASQTTGGSNVYYDVGDGGTADVGDVRQSTALSVVSAYVQTDTGIATFLTSDNTDEVLSFGTVGTGLTIILTETGAGTDLITNPLTGTLVDAGFTCNAHAAANGGGAVEPIPANILSVKCTNGAGNEVILNTALVVPDAALQITTITLTTSTFATNTVVGANDSDLNIPLTAGVDATASFLWTDKSAQSHGITTTDWTRDYLIDVLPTSTQGLNK